MSTPSGSRRIQLGLIYNFTDSIHHKMSVKHLGHYVYEFAGQHNSHPLDTINQMSSIARGMEGKKLLYKELVK